MHRETNLGYELDLSCCLEPRFSAFVPYCIRREVAREMQGFLSSIALATVGEKDEIVGVKCENRR